MALVAADLKEDLKAKMIAARGAPYSDEQLDLICQVFADWLDNTLKNKADIDIMAADLPVSPDTFQVGGVPVTGKGVVDPKLLTMRIK